MTGPAPAADEEERAAGLAARLRAWFAALSGQPASQSLLDHVDALERREAGPSAEA